eukprot:TRINITY_DN19279_c0_g1_i1.p1 TRINITY_DN19279_c0_g1~~TRINITY_DN19279_c0_g1_i1.p1  ORF type:complete len:414 (+),score=45.88 TRINITY_DN19279_c0_g1_i1:51-1244(+)
MDGAADTLHSLAREENELREMWMEEDAGLGADEQLLMMQCEDRVEALADIERRRAALEPAAVPTAPPPAAAKPTDATERPSGGLGAAAAASGAATPAPARRLTVKRPAPVKQPPAVGSPSAAPAKRPHGSPSAAPTKRPHGSPQGPAAKKPRTSAATLLPGDSVLVSGVQKTNPYYGRTGNVTAVGRRDGRVVVNFDGTSVALLPSNLRFLPSASAASASAASNAAASDPRSDVAPQAVPLRRDTGSSARDPEFADSIVDVGDVQDDGAWKFTSARRRPGGSAPAPQTSARSARPRRNVQVPLLHTMPVHGGRGAVRPVARAAHGTSLRYAPPTISAAVPRVVTPRAATAPTHVRGPVVKMPAGHPAYSVSAAVQRRPAVRTAGMSAVPRRPVGRGS